jgi:hypothetical protein
MTQRERRGGRERERERERDFLVTLLINTSKSYHEGPTFMTSSNPNHFPGTLSPNAITLEAKISAYD